MLEAEDIATHAYGAPEDSKLIKMGISASYRRDGF